MPGRPLLEAFNCFRLEEYPMSNALGEFFLLEAWALVRKNAPNSDTCSLCNVTGHNYTIHDIACGPHDNKIYQLGIEMLLQKIPSCTWEYKKRWICFCCECEKKYFEEKTLDGYSGWCFNSDTLAALIQLAERLVSEQT